MECRRKHKSADVNALVKHVQKDETVHNYIWNYEPDRPFACDYKSKYEHHLKEQMILHSNEKPFACKICGYRAKFERNLKNLMLVHMEEKPFICNVITNQSISII